MFNERRRLARPMVSEEGNRFVKVSGKERKGLLAFGQLDRSLQVAQGIVMASNHQVQTRDGRSEAKLIRHVAGILCLPKCRPDFVRASRVAFQESHQAKLPLGPGIEVPVAELAREGENFLPIPAALLCVERADADRIDIRFDVGFQKQCPQT